MGHLQDEALPEVRRGPAGQVGDGVDAEEVEEASLALGVEDARGDSTGDSFGFSVPRARPAGAHTALAGGLLLVAFDAAFPAGQHSQGMEWKTYLQVRQPPRDLRWDFLWRMLQF